MADDGSNDSSLVPRVGRGLIALASVLVGYYLAPVGEFPSEWDLVVSVVGLLAALGALAWVALRQVRRVMAHEGDGGARLDVLVLILLVVVPLFALGYYAVEQGDGGQFAELTTKTDSLYFTLSTLATVGFGDVHATGQLARGLVSLQIVFDVVFVAGLVSVLTSQLRQRASERRGSGRLSATGAEGAPPAAAPVAAEQPATGPDAPRPGDDAGGV